MTKSKIEPVESTAESDAQFIRERLNEYNNRFVPQDHHEGLCLVARKDEQIVAGLTGGTYWNWMYIELFWVDEKERKSGLGTKILEKAEEIAVRRGCGNAHLETHDFQSLDFYKKRGYIVFGELQDLPEVHTKYYLRKKLS